jgi:hypothetical protein
MLRSSVVGIALVICLSVPARGFGPPGHRLVGAIADGVLASKPAAAKLASLLDGLTLTEAAVIADDIKDWDGHPSPNLPWTQKPRILAEMSAYLKANHNHRTYHYTDISVVGDLKYTAGKTGCRPDDVVQMVKYCIEVLENKQPQPNPRYITPRVAVILLAHFVGDMHQPLHIGAAYFSRNGKLVNPDAMSGSSDDQGGNKVELFLSGHTAGVALHQHWDDGSVDAAIRAIKVAMHGKGSTLTPSELSAHFVTKTPDGWPLDAGIALGDLSTAWANEMMTPAVEAHQRLHFATLTPQVTKGQYTYFWIAQEAPPAGGYKDFSGAVVDTTIHRAGWRLARLIEALL